MRLNRQNIQVNSGFDGADFRGYQGLVVSGEVSVGDEVVISPGGHRAKIKSILGASRRFIDSALPQESVTLFLDQDYDVSRGTLFTDVNNPMLSSNEFNAELCWFDEAPLDLSRTYLMKQMSKATRVRLEAINELVNVETLERTANHLSMCINDIGQVSLKTQTALSFDSFKSNQGTGAFILIDEVSNRTVAAGTIQ